MTDTPPPPPPPPPLSKKQQRKQQKARWLAERKAARAASGDGASTRKRRNQRQTHLSSARPSATASPAIRYEACASATCVVRATHSGCVVRSVAPYAHRFALHAKGHWAGRTLRELFASEFPRLSAAASGRAARMGLLRINGVRADLADRIRADDFFEHVVHRHEPSVHLPAPATSPSSSSPLASTWVHHETAELLVVDKPAGLPVHPSGRYRVNSLTLMLQHEHEHRIAPTKRDAQPLQLFPVHRLDRVTSGLLLLAKTTDMARHLTAALTTTTTTTTTGEQVPTGRRVRKFYVARVQGAFPLLSECEEGDDAFGGATSPLVKVRRTLEDGFWRVTAPIGTLTHHTQTVSDAADAKPCETLLRRRGDVTDGESVVECVPVTGRTHQIRVHLQHLGFPIVNDPLYGPRRAAETSPLKEGEDAEAEDQAGEEEGESEEQRCVRACQICSAADEQPSEEEDVPLWLHSYRYESQDWSFSVPLPAWATPSQ
ncbi:hypothetical protein BBJ28_00008911 [Nothophytophthora sp. Chile5]|nr:hypothetical protein BBJ28_00008911 [Nothophytophthora sp. Chile5]